MNHFILSCGPTLEKNTVVLEASQLAVLRKTYGDPEEDVFLGMGALGGGCTLAHPGEEAASRSCLHFHCECLVSTRENSKSEAVLRRLFPQEPLSTFVQEYRCENRQRGLTCRCSKPSRNPRKATNLFSRKVLPLENPDISIITATNYYLVILLWAKDCFKHFYFTFLYNPVCTDKNHSKLTDLLKVTLSGNTQ